MALKVETLTREFKFNGMVLQDPGPAMSADAVREYYAITYPELTNAAVEGPEQKGTMRIYEFRRAVGTKGAGGALREQLHAHIAGETPTHRGNAITRGQVEAGRPFAEACMHLELASRREGAERVEAPSELLAPLP